MSNRKAPHACHIPAWNDQYQQHLLASLNRLGIKAESVGFARRGGLELGLVEGFLRGWIKDVLHIHWQHPFVLGQSRFGSRVKSAFFLGQVALLRMLGIRIVWTIHNLKNHENRFVDLEIRACTRLARLVHEILVHCEAARQDVIDCYGVHNIDKVQIVPHGVSPADCEDRSSARDLLDIPSGHKVFLFFGLIRPYKGLEELLSAFARLEDDDVMLLVAGQSKNPELTALAHQVADGRRVRALLGFVPDDLVPRIMGAADIVAYPYRDIFTSGGVVTAMSHGKPVIAPRLGCIPEVLPAKGGFLYDPQQEEALLGALREASRTPQERLQSMGRLNRSICEQWAWDDIASEVAKVYDRSTGRTPPDGS